MPPPSDQTELFPAVARFGQFVLDNQERIIRHWLTVVDRSPEVPGSEDLTYRQLLDHLPELCLELGSLLKRPDAPSIRDQAARDAGAHGRKRWQQGYNLAELIREVCLIRNDMLDVWLDVFLRENSASSAESRTAICKLVMRFFDDLVIESTVQFASEQIAEMETIHEALLHAETAAHSAKTEVLRHVSHTLREPLGAINFAAEALTEETLSSDGQNNVRIILRNLKVHRQNVNELLTAAELSLQPLAKPRGIPDAISP